MSALKKENLRRSLFGGEPVTPEERVIVDIPIADIYDHPKHTYEVVDDEAMDQLVAEIEEFGVVDPINVREKPTDAGGFEGMDGHRRRHASKKAGKTTIPAFIRNWTDEQSDIWMNASNSQRPELKISEKSRGLLVEYEARKRRAGRKKENASQVETQKRTDDLIASAMRMNRSTLQRLLRVAKLEDDLLKNYVDPGILPLNAGVEISFMLPAEQITLAESLAFLPNQSLSIEQASRLKQASKERRSAGEPPLGLEDIALLLTPEVKASDSKKNASAPKRKFALSGKKLDRYFPKTYTQEEIDAVMVYLLNDWAEENNPDYGEE